MILDRSLNKIVNSIKWIVKLKKFLKKKNKSKIICLTAYSKNIAEEVDKYTDITLVGDSLGSVLYNYKTTRKVTFLVVE